jgi:Tfp pilus assembly protein PilV
MGVMTSTRRIRLRDLGDRLSGDGGFALIEVIVSAVLLVVLATATLNMIDKSSSASAITRQRAVASGLAQEDQDGMRVMAIAQLGSRSTTYPKTIGATTYSISSSATWVRDSGTVTCASNTNRTEYLKTTSSVTWPGHEANPVVLESYVSPGVEAVTKGALTIKLHSDLGVGVSGVPTSLDSGPNATTDQTGCALYTSLDAGATNANWDGSSGDYVDRNGVQTPQVPVTIGAGQTAQVDSMWDQAGKLSIQWVDENNNAIPVAGMTTPTTVSGSLGAGVTHTSITNPANQVRLFDHNTNSVAAHTPLDPHIPPTNPTTISELFPFASAYSIFAGGCGSNIPTKWLSTYTMAKQTVPLLGATSATTRVLLPTAAIWLTGTNTTDSVTGMRLINQDTDTNCIDSTTITPAGTGSGTANQFHVPFGIYNICIQKGSGSSAYKATGNTGAAGSSRPYVPATAAQSYTINVTPSGTTGTYAQTHDTTLSGNTTAAGESLNITNTRSAATTPNWQRGTC